ncbi:MAG TPA: LLM class flavin-dependent oxidoreductase [Acidimicrobiia bacterium]|nr:LLM class flavin-dependent oxidoreductase [Acidimicrobiia bacterium]
MRFAISIPQVVEDGAFDPDALQRFLARAEELGFESAWTQEQVLGTVPVLGPLETMAYAVACTTRLRFGCAVLITTLHSPVHLAKSVSTLDQLSRGRVEIGVGTGGRRMFSAFGVVPETFVARFSEGIELMKALWTQPEVKFAGRFWQVEGAAMEPKPFQKPYPPLWFGGNAPTALRRAARHGDGFIGAGSQTTAAFAEQVPVVREALAEQGRTDFRIAKRVYLAVDDDVVRARERLSAALERLYSFFGVGDLTPVAVYGPPAACIEGLAAVAEAGAEMILLNPLFDEAEQMERLAADVMPHVG